MKMLSDAELYDLLVETYGGSKGLYVFRNKKKFLVSREDLEKISIEDRKYHVHEFDTLREVHDFCDNMLRKE